jgi:hypothetical protein
MVDPEAVRLQDKGDGPEQVKLVLHHYVAQLVILSNLELQGVLGRGRPELVVQRQLAGRDRRRGVRPEYLRVVD